MFTIGEFSKLAKTTIRTLRFYDEIGLFKPAFTEENGYRYYKAEDLGTLAFIIELRSIGLSIDEIKGVLSGKELLPVLKNRKKVIESEIEQNKRNVLLINKMIEKEGSAMHNYHATEQVIPSYTVYYRHGTIATMANLFDFVLEAGAECGKYNPTLKCLDYCFVTYEANEYQETNVELEYVEAVENVGTESQNIKFKKIPETKVISVEHHGAYQDLQQAYAFALNYVSEKGYEVSGKPREVYVHGCWDCESEEDYLTVIQVPVN